MKLFLRSTGLALALILTPFSLVSLCRADVDPDAVSQKSEDPADSTGSALGQYPAPETAPMPQQPPLQQVPMTSTVQPAAAPAASASSGDPNNPNSQGADFPKVQTSQDELLARKFSWWPTDAKPAPFKDPDRSGYWWWPEIPGESRPWGNQGYIYVRKIIFDYKTTEGPMKPSLVIKRIIKNVKILFDFDKANLRDDAREILDQAMFTLQHNPKADILITGNADIRGSEQYNQKLGERRAAAVQDYMTQQGLAAERIRILSRGKMDALAPTHDIVGMQKDRNAQFMIAEVEEVMIPADKANLFEDKVLEEKQEVESAVKVSTKDYVIQTGDTLWAIAKREYGDGRQWKRIAEFNKDILPNPNKPKKGLKIQIPIE
jgi:outer membrane protein OmpA-like peptidoglycan-associated protein